MSKLPFTLLLLICSTLSSFTLSQQLYENNIQLNCNINGSSTLGYACNSRPSCQSYLTFRSQTNYQTLTQISTLLNSSSLSSISQLNQIPNPNSPTPLNRLLIIPTPCSCSNDSYNHKTTYVLAGGDNYFSIANNTYQGLSTCQALIALNPSHNFRNLTAGISITVPLRCACPTAKQTASGFRYLISYLISPGDDSTYISNLFNTDLSAILFANSLDAQSTIYPYTTLLIPLKNPPTSPINLPPPPPPQQPTPPSPPPPPSSSSNKSIFIGVGVAAALLLFTIAVVLYFCVYRRRRRGRVPGQLPRVAAAGGGGGRKKNSDGDVYSTSNDYGALSSEKASTAAFVSSDTLRSFMESLTVYKFSELDKATASFSDERRIRGAVYRAVINGDDAAVKRMKGDVSGEIRILKQINHSNVVRLSGFCVHEGYTYLVYEFVERGSLADWIHDSTAASDCVLSWKQRVRVAYDVADGLNYLHNYANPPYVHKNLKSSNVLLDGDFRAKLANFGLARPVEEDEEPQLTRHVVGTQGYMAPEYLEHGLITPKLDVFAFGVMMMELLSGREATFAKDGDEKGDLMLWVVMKEVMTGEDVRNKLKDLIDPCLGNEYPFDLAFALAELAVQCVAREPGSRPAIGDVLVSLSAIYGSTLDWDPSDVGHSGSWVQAR